jgi:ubiquitin-conjugating enzyme E2 M
VTDCSYKLKLRQLQQKKKEEREGQAPTASKVSPAQLRIQKDLAEIQLPKTINLRCLDKTSMNLEVVISPDEGYYQGGKFTFSIQISHNFPIEPPRVKCLQRIYHPNIDLDGNICLNILREDWSPVLNLNSILVGLLFLFLEPNATDPLNKESANVLMRDKGLFARQVRSSMNGGSIGEIRYDYVL